MGKRSIRPPTLDRLKYLLSYDPQSGVFRWENPQSNRVKKGSVAGGVCDHGYRVIGIDGKTYRASALAILYMTGKYPKEVVDHKDRDRSNDSFENIRPATYQENSFNSGAHADNHCGFKGVHLHKQTGKWRAQIRVGRKIHIGLFDTPREAHQAYMEKARELHGSYFTGGENR